MPTFLRRRLLLALAGSWALTPLVPVPARAGWLDDDSSRADYERLERHARRAGEAPEFDTMRLSIKPWLSKGHGITQSGFPFPGLVCEGFTCFHPLKSQTSLGNTVDFKEREHLVLVVNYELRVHRRLSFDVEAGGSDYGQGRASDHQWLQSPDFILYYFPTDTTWREANHVDWSLSEALVHGDNRMLSSNAYFRVLIVPSRRTKGDDQVRQAFDVFAGYTLYQDIFYLSQGSQILTDRTYFAGWSRAEGPFTGLDSKYRFRWEGFRFGIREEVDLPGDFTAAARFAYAPDLEYQGEGSWNMDKPLGVGGLSGKSLKQGGPNSLQTARGRSFDWAVSAGWNPWRFLSFELGFMYMYFKGGRGTDKTLYSDGSFEDIELERVYSKRTGLFTGLTFKY